jgi:hypothetical protein
MSFCLGSTIKRGAFNTSVLSALTQSGSGRLATSDRTREGLLSRVIAQLFVRVVVFLFFCSSDKSEQSVRLITDPGGEI